MLVYVSQSNWESKTTSPSVVPANLALPSYRIPILYRYKGQGTLHTTNVCALCSRYFLISQYHLCSMSSKHWHRVSSTMKNCHKITCRTFLRKVVLVLLKLITIGVSEWIMTPLIVNHDFQNIVTFTSLSLIIMPLSNWFSFQTHNTNMQVFNWIIWFVSICH